MRSANLSGWPWLGAPLALDLANTVVTIGEDEVQDLLTTEADLDGWLAVEGARLPPTSTGARLEAFRHLRDVLHRALTQAAEGRRLEGRLVEEINAAAAEEPAISRLVHRGARLRAEYDRPADPVLASLSLIARSAVDVLGGPLREQLRICHAPSCGMFYSERRHRNGAFPRPVRPTSGSSRMGRGWTSSPGPLAKTPKRPLRRSSIIPRSRRGSGTSTRSLRWSTWT